MKLLHLSVRTSVVLAVGAFAAGAELLAAAASKEIHVAVHGNDTHSGSKAQPLKTIAAAASLAQSGDTVIVHQGIYRERVNPPRGGTSDACRITYQAAPGEKVTITGSDAVKGWEKVSGDTWKVTLPSAHFGAFNPYAEKVYGDWFNGCGRIHRRGNVYLDGKWLVEAPNLDAVMKPAGANPMWFSTVDGLVDDEGPTYLLNIVSFKTASGIAVTAARASTRSGTRNAPCSEGGECVGFITQGSWLRYDNVDFGAGSERVEIRAATAPGTGGVIELRDGHFDGELLGTCEVSVTGDWQKWQPFTAKIKKTAGVKNLYMVFKSFASIRKAVAQGAGNTVIYAQFPGVNPNDGAVEISVRPTVFTPEKTNIDYITVRGFDLRNAASNWAAPTAGQVGLVTAYWCKGWIIENNEISYSRCCGIALGKYSDQWDGKRGSTEGYYLTIDDALKKDGWSKDKIGGHLVRNNHIHHCGQTGIVGSLGCAFSTIVGNDIHDCNMQGIWSGAEMGGIKFHGAIDTVITGNHIHHNGHPGGLWLDWMAQGTQISNNLFHDNLGQDLFTEVDHGPFLVANNIFLSPGAYLANSEGGAYAHNLVMGRLQILSDGRNTPYHKAHSTEPHHSPTGSPWPTLTLHNCPIGDVRWYNNLLAGRCNLDAYNGATLPVAAAGNVFVKGATPSKFEAGALSKPDFDVGVKLVQKSDGWYLEFNGDPKWAAEQMRQTVTTELLGKAVIPNLPFENPDGSPIKIDTDYFGSKRNAANPFPGPFETLKEGRQVLKVWPR